MRSIVCLLLLSCLAAGEEKKVPFEQKVTNSKPLEFEPQVIKKGDAILQVTPLMMEKPHLSSSFSSGPNSIKVEKGGLHVVFKADEMTHHLLKLPAKDGKLIHDATFGEEGIKPYDRKESEWKTPEKFNWMHKVESRPMGGGLVGFKVSEKGHWLSVKSKDGEEVAVLGKLDNGDSKICYLHNFCAWKNLVFLVDGNCRKVSVWTLSGENLFDIACREMGLDYPWVTCIDITADGTMYLGFTQGRREKEGDRMADVTESGFLKITGLDTIKPGK